MKSQTLKKIQTDIEKNLNCPLKDAAKNLVFGKGNANADILFIGEAPGAKEDETGLPFMGAAGKRLNSLLESIGLTLEDIYIANIVKYRPPKNRDPTYDEIMNHTPYLLAQIKAIQPKIIMPMGRFATEFVLAGFSADKKKMKAIPQISQIHGKLHIIKHNNQTYKVIPLYHPAAMIYRPTLRTELEKDMVFAKSIITGTK